MSNTLDASEAVDLLVDLIRNACVNNGEPESGNEIRSVETVQKYLGEPGVVVEPLPGRASVIYRLKGLDASAPTLLMIPHLDVVPATAQDWTHDPFEGIRSDGFVWGRGAIDMLNLTAAMIVVYRWLRDGILPAPQGDVVLACVADEEAGGTLGAKLLVDEHWDLVACDYLLTEIAGPIFRGPEGAALSVTVAEKGPMWRKASTSGTPGHGSQPFQRDNAVYTLSQTLTKIGGSPQPVGITEQWTTFVPNLGLSETITRMLVDENAVDEAIDVVAETDEALARWIHACTHMTLSPNVVTGGTKINMIPDTATADIDIRVLPGQDEDDLDGHLRKILGPELFEKVTFDPVIDMEATGSQTSGPLWDAIADAAEEHIGTRKLAPMLVPFSTDARFFRERGIPSYGVGLFDESTTFSEMLAMFHGIDEKVSEQSVRDTTLFLSSVVTAFSARSISGS